VPTTALPAPTAEPSAAEPTLETLLKAQAYGLGFDLVGIARLGPVASASAFEEWVAAGYAGEMAWLARGAEKRRDTRLSVPASLARTDERAPAVSAVVVAMDYGGREPEGPVARYARGQDYHAVLEERLRALHRWLEVRLGRAVPGKPYVDTGPLLERDLARRAGLGWFGKNTNLIHPTRGSFHFLGTLLVGLELAPDAPFEADRCGTCTRCLDACPTDAFVAPRVLDATRCVSYLTIELQGAIDEALREGVGDRVYGCDVCQSVCPFNVKFARALADDSPFAPREALGHKDARTLARTLLGMSPSEFSDSFRGSPVKRAKLRGLKRNAAVVLGNVGSADDVPALVAALLDDEPLVRAHAAWALGRLGGPAAVAALRDRMDVEPDASVRSELGSALGAVTAAGR
jgi:epoxyqueuosine reductase